MEERQHIILFDRFLAGEMDPTEKTAFEERLLHSESLKKSFDAYVSFSKEIAEGGEYGAIKENLSAIHNELYKKKKTNILRAKFLVPLGIAASIGLLFIFSPWSGMSDTTSIENENYEPLANHFEQGNTDKSDEYLDDTAATETVGDLNANNQNESLIDSLGDIKRSPIGTAFLISENGFFLTSKHLIEGKKTVDLQQKELGITFEVSVVYSDSILDFAILKSSIKMALNFQAVPYELVNQSPELGDEVFTLGYTKRDIVYTQGAVSSETGFESDSIYYEVSMPSNTGHSGAPLFNEKGKLIGIITAHLSDKQSVTYILRPDYIQHRLDALVDSLPIDVSTNYTRKNWSNKRLIKLYRPYIFEVH